jgi:hypothetical protein
MFPPQLFSFIEVTVNLVPFVSEFPPHALPVSSRYPHALHVLSARIARIACPVSSGARIACLSPRLSFHPVLVLSPRPCPFTPSFQPRIRSWSPSSRSTIGPAPRPWGRRSSSGRPHDPVDRAPIPPGVDDRRRVRRHPALGRSRAVSRPAKQRRPTSRGSPAGTSGDKRKDQSRTAASVYELRGRRVVHRGLFSPGGQGRPPGPACGSHRSRCHSSKTHQE